MSANRSQLLDDLRVALDTNDKAGIVRLLGVLRKGVPVDPLAPCFDRSTAKILTDRYKPTVLVWHLIPEEHRKAAGQAMLDGAQAVRKQVTADKEVGSTVMHLAGYMLAEADLSRYINLFKMVTDDGPTADVGRRASQGGANAGAPRPRHGVRDRGLRGAGRSASDGHRALLPVADRADGDDQGEGSAQRGRVRPCAADDRDSRRGSRGTTVGAGHEPPDVDGGGRDRTRSAKRTSCDGITRRPRPCRSST